MVILKVQLVVQRCLGTYKLYGLVYHFYLFEPAEVFKLFCYISITGDAVYAVIPVFP